MTYLDRKPLCEIDARNQESLVHAFAVIHGYDCIQLI